MKQRNTDIRIKVVKQLLDQPHEEWNLLLQKCLIHEAEKAGNGEKMNCIVYRNAYDIGAVMSVVVSSLNPSQPISPNTISIGNVFGKQRLDPVSVIRKCLS
ncbi:MAG: hypothetical protein CM1200mP30_11370 [Pseudomonadota bacterium]|nr:MAG: hypothetical protein CM1200mP30_11370 [Pseudomonadota bacterium]